MQNEIYITDEESKICKLDGKVFSSSKKMIWHVRKNYKLNFEEYIIKAYYNGVRPVCLKTGKELTFKASKLGPFFHNFSRNASPRTLHSKMTREKIKRGCENTAMKKFGVKNVFSTEWCKSKIKTTMREKYGVDNIMEIDDIKRKVLLSFYNTLKLHPRKFNKTSSLETDLKLKLDTLNIKYESPFHYEGKRYDFFLPDIGVVLEIDGDAFHKDTLEKLTLMTINGSVNDHSKNKLIKNLQYDFYRIRYNSSKFSFSDQDELLNKIKNSTYTPDYTLTYKQKIISKEYFQNYIKSKGVDKLEKYIGHLLKFIRTFSPTLPYPDEEESASDIIKKIHTYDIFKIFNTATNEFSNLAFSVGNNYLKRNFKSYWKSKFKGHISPEEAWNDDKIMHEVIKYRIGCNNSNEIFDFSLYQLIRGLSARRITVSFFKPLLAAAIYQRYLNVNNCPVVLDPCCGFGGRLLGFKSKYPNGKYIGCEPNIETYNELLQLISNLGWKNVEIHNCKFEDYYNQDKWNYDLIFTSIPYYDVETYSNTTTYDSFEKWKETFICCIEQYKNKNCYINAPEDLCNRLNWNTVDSYIISNRSHFDPASDFKRECIVKI